MVSIVNLKNIQLSARITIVSPIFQRRVVSGRHQINGNARGPTVQIAMIIKDFRKYHLIVFSLWCGRGDASRNSPQCLHFIAASWISSAQYGHVFILSISLGQRLNFCFKYTLLRMFCEPSVRHFCTSFLTQTDTPKNYA